MNHLMKLALPIGLGLFAGFLNWMTVSSRIKPHDFVKVKDKLRAGEDFTDDNLERFPLQGTAEELSETLIPWKDRAVLYHRPAPRDLAEGDVVFWRDATAPKLKLSAGPGELEFRVGLRDLQAIPKDVRAGQHVSFRMGQKVSTSSVDRRKPQAYETTAEQTVGPYRVLEVGGFSADDGTELDEKQGYLVVAIRSDDDSLERLYRAMDVRNDECILGVFVDR